MPFTIALQASHPLHQSQALIKLIETIELVYSATGHLGQNMRLKLDGSGTR